uniref:Putative wrp salivary protein n=1 Tax=Culex tarsalis TaxID=7177 RepID=A0A1Q3FTS4_CULTA
MICVILLGLVLVLVPVEPANPPTGCVTLMNLYAEKFLTHSYSTHDKNRRHVSLFGVSEKWNLVKTKEGHYTLRHRSLNEELFESELNYKGNYVFTWIPKSSVTSGEWDIWESKPGYFYIQNVKFKHYLSGTPTAG